MKPLGIDVAEMARGAVKTDLAPHCPGANLRVTRSDLSSLTVGGERFRPSSETIPYEGYGSARVVCDQPAERVTAPTHGTQHFGICRSCSRLEADNRALLRSRQGVSK